MLCFYCSLRILYFICILLLLLPTWRIKPDDDGDKPRIWLSYKNIVNIFVSVVQGV